MQTQIQNGYTWAFGSLGNKGNIKHFIRIVVKNTNRDRYYITNITPTVKNKFDRNIN